MRNNTRDCTRDGSVQITSNFPDPTRENLESQKYLGVLDVFQIGFESIMRVSVLLGSAQYRNLTKQHRTSAAPGPNGTQEGCQ